MDAFNIPYSLFDPNQTIPSCHFATSETYSFTTGASQAFHTIIHDICMIHFNTKMWYSNNTITRDICITAYKETNLSKINFAYPPFEFSKSGAEINMNKLNGSGAQSVIVVIYEFNFV